MKISIATFFILILTFAMPCFSQKSGQSKNITKKLSPNLYIAFVEKGEYLNFDKEKIPVAWFRFYNNTKRKVAFQANGGIKDNDLSLFYDILDDNNIIIESKYCHVCSTFQLSSGSSVLFRIPLEYIIGSNLIRINYNYGREETPNSSLEEEFVHQLYFKVPQFLKK